MNEKLDRMAELQRQMDLICLKEPNSFQEKYNDLMDEWVNLKQSVEVGVSKLLHQIKNAGLLEIKVPKYRIPINVATWNHISFEIKEIDEPVDALEIFQLRAGEMSEMTEE